MVHQSHEFAKQPSVRIFNAGFSLLELLVVIVIIGIAVSFATLTFGDNQAKRMSHKSQQLAALIELAKEQAIFNSQELGLLFTKNSYTFYKLGSAVNKKKEKIICIHFFSVDAFYK